MRNEIMVYYIPLTDITVTYDATFDTVTFYRGRGQNNRPLFATTPREIQKALDAIKAEQERVNGVSTATSGAD